MSCHPGNSMLRMCHLPTRHSLPHDWHCHWLPIAPVPGSAAIGYVPHPYRLSSPQSHPEASLTDLSLVISSSGYKVPGGSIRSFVVRSYPCSCSQGDNCLFGLHSGGAASSYYLTVPPK